MAPTTQRLKYFDGEFLQSGDFTDEQTYHVDMRRLLNQQLHLHGIVKGLHIVQDANSVPSTPAQFLSVAPGFAIDQIGREIYVTAPASLTPLLSLAGLQQGTYEVWIVYTETATGTPAPGYKLCNQLSQNTRWTESFALMLRNPSVVPASGTPNPNLDLKGICLGLVSLTFDPTIGFYFTLPPNWFSRRSYVKIRAQSIIAPDNVYPDFVTLDGPNTLPPHGYINIETPNGVYSEGNLLVTNNILVGDDFTIENTNPIGPAPSPTNPNGNLKLNSDIFMNGKIYTNPSGNWVDLGTYIASQVTNVLDIQLLGPQTQAIPPNGGTISAPPVNTKLATFSNVIVQANITGLTFVNGTTLTSWLPSNLSSGIALSGWTASPSSGTSTTPVTVSVNYAVSGDPSLGTLFDSAQVTFLVIFQA
jgi:hypothetical protein